MKKIVLIFLVLSVLILVLGFYLRTTDAHSKVLTSKIVVTHQAAAVLPPHAYLYYVQKDATGFLLARAVEGANAQPVGTLQRLTSFGNSFGLAETDSVLSLQLSPDGQYLAVDGTTDHDEIVWTYDTAHNTLKTTPQDVSGNFLHWLPNGHSFLYRPVLPMGPNAPIDGDAWNPGLWIVDASMGSHKNIDPGVPSASLVDAAPSPDGSHMVFSTSEGLGMGSQVWLMNSDGSGRTPLFTSAQGSQSIAGLFSWSPDGSRIAYERLSDSSTPFLPAGLWTMNNQGAQQQRIADIDGGHGFTLSWSPDSRKLAFVVRTNVGDHHADQQAQALHCAIGIANVTTNRTWLAATPKETGMQMNIHPTWLPDSSNITFTALNAINRVLGSTPRYWSVRVSTNAAPSHVTPLTPVMPRMIAAQ